MKWFFTKWNDLSEKMKISRDDKLKKIAKNGKKKYMKFNSNIVSNYIIHKTLELPDKNKYLWE